MTYTPVALGILFLVGCTATKPPAPTSVAPAAPPAAPAGAPLPAPAPPVVVQPAPAAPSRPPTPQPAPVAPSPPPSPAPAVAPGPRVLYVKVHRANLREGAGTSMKILRVLRQGARLEILEESTDWVRVRLDDGQEGWIAASVTAPTTP